ncbi:uncharacterized protein LOC131927694 [Physella acuta]|uniref:uncharacterized protein LOC131927694 n=1 Tax=Physella acuta TaxID=109671 RepID=UPI0027DDC061|nr:uncharacterized protein LOC131927694 [Physella acuta]XP_059139442.1 uncharacterized protein LOC131927694 [Physella acuta]
MSGLDDCYLPSLNKTSSSDLEFYETVTTSVLAVVPMFLIIMGTVGNILTLIVLTSKAISHKSYSLAISLRFLACMDILVLWTLLGRHFVSGVLGEDIRNWSFDVCRIHKTWHIFCTTVVNWTLVLIAVTRYVSIAYPFRSHLMVTEGRTLVFLGIIIVISGCASLIPYKQYVSNLQFNEEYLVETYNLTPMEFLHLTCDLCPLNPKANVSHYKFLLMLPNFIVPMACVLVFHCRIVKTYHWLFNKRQKLQQQYTEQVERISFLKKSVKNGSVTCEDINKMEHFDMSTSKSPRLDPKLLNSNENIELKSILRQSKPTGHSLKKARFSHIMDMETSKILIFEDDTEDPNQDVKHLSFSTLVDPFCIEELRLWIDNEEKALKRTQTAVDILSMALNLGCPYRMKRKLSVDGEVLTPTPTPWCRWLFIKVSTLNIIYISTVLMFLFNTPYVVWYIFSPLFFGHSRREITQRMSMHALISIWQLASNAVNCIVYVFLNNKMQEAFRSYLSRRSVSEHVEDFVE